MLAKCKKISTISSVRSSAATTVLETSPLIIADDAEQLESFASSSLDLSAKFQSPRVSMAAAVKKASALSRAASVRFSGPLSLQGLSRSI